MRISIDKRLRPGVTITAGDLAARMMGSVITFGFRQKTSQVYAVLIGELRQASWGGGTVSILIAAHDADGGGALEEFEVEESHEITFLETLS